MNAKATFAVAVLLSGSVAAYALSANSNSSDSEKIANLERTVTEMQNRINKLEHRVNDISTPKARLINKN